MKKYVAKRLGISVLTLLAILLILFLMLEFMPGSPFNDEKLNEAQVAILNAKYGLDKPVVFRFRSVLYNFQEYFHYHSSGNQTSNFCPHRRPGSVTGNDYRFDFRYRGSIKAQYHF